jgi:hypothetical protein
MGAGYSGVQPCISGCFPTEAFKTRKCKHKGLSRYQQPQFNSAISTLKLILILVILIPNLIPETSKYGKYYFADLRMTFRQNFFLQDWFRNKFGIGFR